MMSRMAVEVDGRGTINNFPSSVMSNGMAERHGLDFYFLKNKLIKYVITFLYHSLTII